MSKVWKVPQAGNASLPIPSKPYIPNNEFYSLYKKSGKGIYTRVSSHAYSNGRIAGRVFGPMISSDPLVYSIRPCKVESLKAGKENRFGRCPFIAGMTK